MRSRASLQGCRSILRYAGLALLNCARAVAFLNGRGFVLPEDVQHVFVAVAAHRLTVRDAGLNARAVATQILKKTAAI